MTRVYIADSLPEERSALRLLILDLEMEVAGEAIDWPATLDNVPTNHLDILLLDWSLLPSNLGTQALTKLRMLCPSVIIIVLLSHLDAHKQVAISASANSFISKGDMPERVAEHLRLAAASVPCL
jgi:DNA-binding NarL/FixJ family response regulator